jgi:hypothetical protein
LKPERWGSPLVQEKYREEKAYDKRHPYRIIIIIGFVSAFCYALKWGALLFTEQANFGPYHGSGR